MNKRLTIFLLLLILFAIPNVSARIITNSQDWRDVYSAMLYGKLIGGGADFLVSQSHARSLIEMGGISNVSILLVNSPKLPFAFGYQSLLETMGARVDVISSDNNNLELAKRSNITNFIILDDAYGYNAVSVGSYALLSNSYVLFINSNNLNSVVTFLQQRRPSKVLIYGHVEREAKDAMTQFNPETINFEDRFLNNIEMVRRFISLKKELSGSPVSQAYLTNGEFVEDSLINNVYPVLFIGKGQVPESVAGFIRNEKLINVGVLVGNQYVGTATDLKRRLGISVFVKFGRSARVSQNGVNTVEGLDMFPLPSYDVAIDIDSVRYNEATKQIEITIKNLKDLATYFKGTYTVSSDQGVVGVVGDNDVQFLEGSASKTLTYDIDLTGKQNPRLQALVLFGEAANSMELAIDRSYNISIVKVLDDSEIILTSTKYDKGNANFLIKVKNTGKITTYVTAEVLNVMIAGEKYNFGTTKVTKISPGSTATLKIATNPAITDLDIESNKIILVEARFGARENSLIKRIRGEFVFALKGADFILYVLIAIIIILILLILFSKKKKKKEEI